MQISGYPNCPTIKTEKWTTGNRPNRPLQGATGFNETLGSLERYNGSDWELLNDFIDISAEDNGYLKIGDKLIIQWGIYTPSNMGINTVQFTIPFNEQCFTVIANKKLKEPLVPSVSPSVNASQKYYACVDDFTTTDFKITYPENYLYTINWIAIGK